MAPKPRRRTYGKTHIAGNARVQLGDRQMTRNIRIESAYIQLQNELGLPDIEALRQALGVGSRHASPDIGPKESQAEALDEEATHMIVSNNSGRDNLGPIRHRVTPRGRNVITESAIQCEYSALPSNIARATSRREALESNNPGTTPVVTYLNTGEQSSGQLPPLRNSREGERVVSSLQALWYQTPPLLGLGNVPASSATPLRTATSIAESFQCECNEAMVKHNAYAHPRKDVFLVIAGMLSCIIGQNVPVKEIGELLILCQKRQLLGLLTCALAFGLYRYLLMRRLVMGPSSPDRLTLEDAYGRLRSISLDVCADFDILTKFLEVHYRDTAGVTAGALVSAGQFHLMLGSRRGKVLSSQEWANTILKPGYKIVNSVYVSRDSAECLLCGGTMCITPIGEFHCSVCKVYHRDCDTINSSVQPTRRLSDGRFSTTATTSTVSVMTSTTSSALATTESLSQPTKSTIAEALSVSSDENSLLQEATFADTEYDTSGLINLSIRLQPQRQRQSHKIDLARVLHTFEGIDDDLNVEKGQIVIVLSARESLPYPANQWWLCEDHLATEGYVPRVCLDIIQHSLDRSSFTGAARARFVKKNTDSAALRSKTSSPIQIVKLKPHEMSMRSNKDHTVTLMEPYSFSSPEKVLRRKVPPPSTSPVGMRGRQGINNERLVHAAARGDEEEIKALLDDGADIESCNEDETALIAACRSGQIKVVELLLKLGAEVEAQRGLHGCALQTACAYGRHEIVRILLSGGANVNLQRGYYGNALQVACAHDLDGVVKMLLDVGADVNAQGGRYGNALLAACACSSLEVVQTLLNAGAEVNAQGSYYGNALNAASVRGRQSIVKLLLQQGAIPIDPSTLVSGGSWPILQPGLPPRSR